MFVTVKPRAGRTLCGAHIGPRRGLAEVTVELQAALYFAVSRSARPIRRVNQDLQCQSLHWWQFDSEFPEPRAD